ncbi:Polysaccharide deacetylase [Syntrophomonas zehnderi OL-4]|uniref:Polysaccharide deacetylase n=1 Tax=Syntrophomonas zehnderi OL-4 TaxID=690567 RepID=A0A0E4C9I2_9FIRM|nr:polysaccharide deacetylase family protein [Syntrophomonas zehnderi]CFY01356.1 Polysaccharide deacetylase [Syntrophomonas zehnderi OL-4]
MKKHLLLPILIIAIMLAAGCHNEKTSGTNNNNITVNPPAENRPQPAVNPAPAPTPPPADSSQQTTSTAPKRSWYFMRNSQHAAPAVSQDIQKILSDNQAKYVLPNNDHKIYLTFDCGYELGYTPTILDTLQSQQVKAAFFITGHFIQSKPELVKRMQSEGHLVCNHTFNHPDLAAVKQEKLQQEITSLENRYQELTGVPMDKYLRPPMGNYSADSLKWTQELGYTTIFWSMAWKDWDPRQQPGADFVYRHVIDNIHPGAIILMHNVSSSDTEALARIITDLKSQGYVFSQF